MKNGKVRFRLNVDVRKEMEDSRAEWIPKNALELITSVKGRLNFSCKSTTAASIDLMESLLDNWLKNNHITVDEIYYLRSLFVFFYEFQFSNLFLNRRKPAQRQKSRGISLKLDLSE